MLTRVGQTLFDQISRRILTERRIRIRIAAETEETLRMSLFGALHRNPFADVFDN